MIGATRGRLTLISLPDFLAYHRIRQRYTYKDIQLAAWYHELGSAQPRILTLFKYFDLYGVDFADWAQFERIHDVTHHHGRLWAEEISERLKDLGPNPFPRGYPKTLESWGSFVVYHKGITPARTLAKRSGIDRRHFTPARLKVCKNLSLEGFLGTLSIFNKTVFDWMAWTPPKENLFKARVKKTKDPNRKKKNPYRRKADNHPWRREGRARLQRQRYETRNP